MPDAASWWLRPPSVTRKVSPWLSFRSTIVTAKFVVVAVWSILLSLLFFAAAMITGSLIGLAGWSAAAAWNWFLTFSVSALLTIVLCTPVAFVASAGRGYLLAIGVVILLLIMTQLLGTALPGFTPYFPWAIPAICSGVGGSALPHAGAASWIVLGLTCVLGYLGTVAWWEFADQA